MSVLSEEFWHLRSDFDKGEPSQKVRYFWTDDESNRQRSLTTFANEIALVDEGLTIYVEAIQGAFRERNRWKNDMRLRASIAMLIHAFNSFLARRHLLTHGYLSEARLLARSIRESLSQALVFLVDESFAKKFYAGRQIQPKNIQKRLSRALADEQVGAPEVFKLFRDEYQRLGVGAHPTLGSFSMRTAAQEPGNYGLQKPVPEEVLLGGLLQDDSGRVAWHALALGIGDGLATVGCVLSDASGRWERQYREYRATVESKIQEPDAMLDEP